MNLSVFFYVMMATGALLFGAAISNWDWFFKQRRAQIFIKMMGRVATRVFYALIGILFMVVGWMAVQGKLTLF